MVSRRSNSDGTGSGGGVGTSTGSTPNEESRSGPSRGALPVDGRGGGGRRGCGGRAALQEGAEARHVVGLPPRPPLEERFLLFGQPPAVEAQQRVDAGADALPLGRPLLAEALAQRLESAGGDVAVVGQAEHLLHLLDA